MDKNTSTRGRWIPWAIVAFFVFFMMLLTHFAVIAFKSYTGQVTMNAYEKGLHYNDTIDYADAQEKLAWKSTVSFIAEDEGVEVTFALRDAKGDNISDAEVEIKASRNTHQGHDIRVKLMPSGQGVYRGSIALDEKGQWDMRISATRGNDNYQQSKLFVLP